MPWWLWTLPPFEHSGGGLERQCSTEFFCLSQTFLLSEERQAALLWLSYSFSRAVTQIWQSLGCVRKFTFTHGKQGCVESDLARREVKSIWKGQIKLECHCHSHKEMKLPIYFFFVSVIYVVVVASTFTLLKLLSSQSALWLLSFSKELSRLALSDIVVLLLLSRKKHSLKCWLTVLLP